jgi:quaternary ammonium compound-resistance protein SugE
MMASAVSARHSGTREPVPALILASVSFAIGAAFMKVSEGFSRPWPSAAVAVFFLAGAVLLGFAIGSEGLSTAYTIGLGIEAVVSIGLGCWMFGERLSIPQVFGVVLILAGVVSVRLG